MSLSAVPAYEEGRIYEGPAAVARLASMGLRVQYFDEAIRRGYDVSSRVTPLHPKTYAGQVMWAETVAQLRTSLLELNAGWKAGQSYNYETSYNMQREIAVAIVGGNYNTGERGFDPPKTARKRGPITEMRIRRNKLGREMFDLPEFKKYDPNEDEQCETWFCLLNARKGTMFSELSYPLLLGASKRIAGWRERILLPSITFNGTVVTPVEPADNQPPKIHVARK